MSLPEAFRERFCEIYPEDGDSLLRYFEKRPYVTFRINPLKGEKEAVLKELAKEGVEIEPVEWCEGAYIADGSFRDLLTHSTLFEDGKIYIQSLSSMTAPMVLDPKPGERVLDLAAAPGGKSIMIAALMKNSGWLSVVEPGKGRFFKMKANIERSGVKIARYFMTDGRTVGNKCPMEFDRVLLDAPCTTEAKFKTFDPKTYAYWSERKIKEMTRLQSRLLASAIKSLKPGGTLLYATCSFEPEENEAVVDKAIAKNPDIQVAPIDLPLKNIRKGLTSWRKKRFHGSITDTVRILPTDRMEGFYLAKLVRK